MCHNSNRSRWSLLMREVEVSINKPWLASTMSVIHERRLLWMTVGRRVNMMCMWPRRTAGAIVNTSMFRCPFRVLASGVRCVNHNISYSWCNMLVDHTRHVNFSIAATVWWRICDMFVMLSDFVRGLCCTCTVSRAAWFLSSFSGEVHI